MPSTTLLPDARRLGSLPLLAVLIAALIALVPGVANAAAGRSQPPTMNVLKVTAHPQRVKTAPGDQFAIAVVLDFKDGWHAWPNKPVLPKGLEDLTATPTEVLIPEDGTPPKGVQVYLEQAQWPEPHEIESAGFTGEPIKVLSLSERAIVYVPVVIGEDAAPGTVTIPLHVPYQACDDTTCVQPTTAKLSVTFEVQAAGATLQNTDREADFAKFDASVFARILSAGAKPAVPKPAANDGADGTTTTEAAAPATTLFGYTLPDPTSPVGIVVLLLVSILGGAIMNLTPCVLPVIPIKVMTLTQHAHGGGALRLGMWMALGIVAFWTVIGVPMAFISAGLDPSRFIFGIWWVTLGIGLVIVMMGLGIMGMFNITLPQSVYKVNPKADTAWGSFVFGIMTAVLGLPCFGFVAGGLLAAAATMPAISTLSVFFGMGVGMAAPFLLLAARPELVKKMPRTGPASELVKQVMGLMLLAAAAFFVTVGLSTLISTRPYLASTMKWWATAFFLSLAAVWLIVRTFQITPKTVRRLVFTAVSLLMMVGSIAFAWSDTQIERENYLKLQAANKNDDSFVTGAWNDYTPAKLKKAQESGKIVVADFTAEWCLICKTLKRTVLNVEPVHSELMRDDIVMIKVDLTDDLAPGWAFLRGLGRTGIPTLAVFPPSEEKPEIFNAYTKGNVLEALERARTVGKAP